MRGRLSALAVFVAGALLTLLAPPTRAMDVLSQMPVDGAGAGISDFGRAQQEADGFLLPGAATVSSIQWWGSYGKDPDPAATDDFTIRLFGYNGGGPAVSPIAILTPAGLTRTATALHNTTWGDHDGGTIYAYTADLSSPLDLAGNSPYFLSVVNNTPSVWGWSESTGGDHWWRSADGTVWNYSDIPTHLAFALSGTVVPEPSTLSLLLVTLPVAAAYRRRWPRVPGVRTRVK